MVKTENKGSKNKEKTAASATKASTGKHSVASAPDVSFEVKPLHKKALLKLLHCHHSDLVLTYPELSDEIGIGEKTKAWQCVAWKDLKGGGFIVPGPSVEGKKGTTYKLSQQGVDLAMTFASDEELEEYKTPATNEEHHKKLRSKLERQANEKGKKLAPKIFDLFLEDPETPTTRLELSKKLGGINPEGHGFFYGFQALQKLGLVCVAGKAKEDQIYYNTKKKTDSDKEGKPKKKKKKTDSDTAGEPKKTAESDQEGEPKKKTVDSDKEGKPKKKATDSEKEDEPKKKKPRIRGTNQLFKLSAKAFLATAPKDVAEE